MSLSLDARQRAMLQEMGVTVWSPAAPDPAAAPHTPGPRPLAQPEAAPTAPAPATRPPMERPAPQAARPIPAPTAAPTPPPVAVSIPRPAPPPPSAHPAGAGAALVLHPPQVLYPEADPARTPPGLGRAWLIVTESLTPNDPLGGDVGRLLDNMLRALQLHRHPRVFLAAVERNPPDAEAPAGSLAEALAQAVAEVQPAMVLVLGHLAARAGLGRTEPLGRLRAEPHQVGACPAIVSYDPAFLLRSQATKAAAWTDLCMALARVRQAAPG
ncbi:MAG: uracil-DNA glycosylase family protein [Burkholderiaceae bacterium]|nr:uracil-DNA glycosylase family protein [Burkholderiaceae bacterium]